MTLLRIIMAAQDGSLFCIGPPKIEVGDLSRFQQFLIYWAYSTAAIISAIVGGALSMRAFSEAFVTAAEEMGKKWGERFGSLAAIIFGIGEILGKFGYGKTVALAKKKKAFEASVAKKKEMTLSLAITVRDIGKHVETTLLGRRFWGRLDKVLPGNMGVVVNPVDNIERHVSLESLRLMRKHDD